MGRKNKISYETKLQAVKAYLTGEGSYKTVALKHAMDISVLKVSVKKYQAGGSEALQSSPRNQRYPQELKIRVVLEYLQGGIGLNDLAVKHGIKCRFQISDWIALYNDGKNLKAYKSGGNNIMNTGRKTSYEERIEIVEDCLRSGLDYHATAAKYSVSYQQVYSWVNKYQKDGVKSLQDGRGKARNQEKMDEVELLKAENQLLKAQIERMKIEDRLKKKVFELQTGLDFTRKKKK